ncbi:MAG: hypothetical protein Q4C73_03730 [Eubacteriales bacterium]|nr:hypothetical protein [Eubacteriales bacterium]
MKKKNGEEQGVPGPGEVPGHAAPPQEAEEPGGAALAGAAALITEERPHQAETAAGAPHPAALSPDL